MVFHSMSFIKSLRLKSTLAGAFLGFFFSSYASSSSRDNRSLLPQFQSQIGLIFPETVIDLTCLASTYPSRFAKAQEKNNHCFTHVFHRYEEIREMPGLTYDSTDQSFISNVYPSLGIKGLHWKVFERKKNNSDEKQYVFIVIRHQEDESYLTDEMNEMMSLFGPAATVDRQQGNKEMFGTSAVASVLRFVRQQLGLDYLPQALNMFQQIQSYYKDRTDVQFIFSGFSSGGLYAILLALYFDQPAITFAATGVEDISRLYYSSIFMDKSSNKVLPPIYNFAHQDDPVLQLDCQIGTLCLYQSKEEKKPEELHLSTIFDTDEPALVRWFKDLNLWICIDPDRYNEIFGSCQRERLRWKDRMQRRASSRTDL